MPELDIQQKDEILASCNALGFTEGSKYLKEPDCKETLKEIMRYLKRDNADHEARFYLGKLSIVSNDLIPLVIQHNSDDELFTIIIKLLVNLTHPVLLIYNNKKPKDLQGQKRFQELSEISLNYKIACSNLDFFEILQEKLHALINKDWENTFDEDHTATEYILILLRNLFVASDYIEFVTKIQIFPDSKNKDIQGQLIKIFETSKVPNLLIYMGSNDEHSPFNLHILEIIYAIYGNYDIKQICKATLYDLANSELRAVKHLERTKEQNILKNKPNPSRFRGTYCIQGLKSISSKDMITHSLDRNIRNLVAKSNASKPSISQPRARTSIGHAIKRDLKGSPETHSFLRKFATLWLNHCYNPFMANIKEKLVRHNALDSDETRYLWAIAFFMEYSRNNSFDVKYYSETLNKETLHYLINVIYKFIDYLMMDKDDGVAWGKRVHLAVMAYKQILLAIDHLSQSSSEEVKEAVKNIKANIFYVPEFREILVQLFKAFNPAYCSMDYLKDLIQTTHIFLRMLKTYCQEYRNLTVLKRSKKRKALTKRRPKTIKQKETNEDSITVIQWDGELEIKLKNLLRNYELPTQIEPKDDVNTSFFQLRNKIFNPISQLSMTDQKMNALYRVYETLRQGNLEHMVEMLHICREIWPDDILFGQNSMGTADQIDLLREIFNSDMTKPENYEDDNKELTDNDENSNVHLENSPSLKKSDFLADLNYENEYDSQGDRTDEDDLIEIEDQFNFNRYLFSFVNPAILQCYATALSDFEENDPSINHAIVKMFYKIAVDMKLPAMFFQITLLQIFSRILEHDNDKTTLKNTKNGSMLECNLVRNGNTSNNYGEKNGPNKYKDLIDFAKYIVKLLFRISRQNPLVFVDLLFWKNVKQSIEIFNCYGLTEKESTAHKDLLEYGVGSAEYMREKKEPGWSEEQDFEIETLYNDYLDKKRQFGDENRNIFENGTEQNAMPAQRIGQNQQENLTENTLDAVARKMEVESDGEDIVDYMQKHLIDDTKTRRQIILRCKKLGLILPRKAKRKTVAETINRQRVKSSKKSNPKQDADFIDDNSSNNSDIINEINSNNEESDTNDEAFFRKLAQNSPIPKDANGRPPIPTPRKDPHPKKSKIGIKNSDLTKTVIWCDADLDSLIATHLEGQINKASSEEIIRNIEEKLEYRMENTEIKKKLVQLGLIPNNEPKTNLDASTNKIRNKKSSKKKELLLPPLTIFDEDYKTTVYDSYNANQISKPKTLKNVIDDILELSDVESEGGLAIDLSILEDVPDLISSQNKNPANFQNKKEPQMEALKNGNNLEEIEQVTQTTHSFIISGNPGESRIEVEDDMLFSNKKRRKIVVISSDEE